MSLSLRTMLTLLMDKPSTDHNSGCNWFRSSCWNYESEGEDSVQVVVSPANESPAARCTTKVIKTSTRSGYSSSVIKSPTGSIISPHQPNKPLTRSEAFNKGLLLQYFFCNGDHYDNSDDEHDFERKWDGHQPLTPNTWAETSSRGVSASELRYLRRRKRRGITTTTSFSTVSSITPSEKVERTLDSVLTPSSNEWSVQYPQDLVDPHLSEWKSKKCRGLGVPELD